MRIKINQKVLRGQPLIYGDDDTVPIHAPTSGIIEDISFNLDSIKQYQKNIKIIILSDNLDKWIRLNTIKNYKKYTPDQLIKKIHQSGIVGLGGAQFSSAKKLRLSINKVDTLILNAVESEPLITADHILLRYHIKEILIGCKIICWISKIKTVLIAIQENQIELISKILCLITNQPLFKIRIIKKKYPAGSSKVLVKALTGKEIPNKKHSIDIGYLVFNVATVYAIKRAIINGEPLTERIVTILDNTINFYGNFWIRIGTQIKHFVTKEKIKTKLDKIVYVGGPFMGKRIFNMNYSILKNVSYIQIEKQETIKKRLIEYECIRCSYCSQVCPVNLLPQQLYWYSRNKNNEQIKKHHILDCIECKACEKVCPSHIPLVKYFKVLKKIEKDNNKKQNFKEISLFRFKSREKRLLNEAKNIINNKVDIELIHTLKHTKSNIFNLNRIDFEKNIRKEKVRKAIERMKLKK